MNHTITRRHRGAAALGVTALALGGLGLLASPANAAPGDQGVGSITVTKVEQPAGGLGANDGSQITDLGGAKPLVAGFTSCAIEGIDLALSSDWDRLKSITVTPDLTGGAPVVAEGGNALALTACSQELTTDAATGIATFADLPADKAYVVWESTPAENAISAAQPSLVTVPYPGTGGGTWNYNPHIYPKNVVVGSGATKDGKIIGDRVEFDVTVPINPLAAGSTYEEFRINDQLADSLTHTGGSVKLLAADGAEVALESADYTLTAPTGAAGSEVVLTLQPSGLAKLDANIGGKLILTITADAGTTGTTANEAKLTVNGKATENGKGPSVVDPESFFADARIVKLAKNKGQTQTVPLAGAEFSLYTAAEAASDCPADAAAEGLPLAFEKVTSGVDGNTPNMVLAEGKYCVYETKTPGGYKGLNGGMLFEVDGEGASLEVLNTQIGADEGDMPSLPLTGSTGGIVFLTVGGVLIAAGAAAILIHRRRVAAGE